MNTKAMAVEVRLAHWTGIMRQRSESGKSIRSWCCENGICEKTYYYWQRKLREAACTRLTAPGFAEITVQEPSMPLALPASSSGQLCVEAVGVRITTDNAYPPERLAALLRELLRSC